MVPLSSTFFIIFPNFTAFHILPPWITLLSLTMLPVVCSTMIFNNFHIYPHIMNSSLQGVKSHWIHKKIPLLRCYNGPLGSSMLNV